MPKIKLTILFCIISILSFGRIGLADWSAITPNDNEINNYTDCSLFLKDKTHLDALEKWYFYKDCIVGKFSEDKGYFVVNEITFKIDTFKNESDFKIFIKKNKLEPKLWTRYYDSNWIFFSYELLFAFVLGFFISIPLLLLYLFTLYKSIVKEKLNFSKPNTKISFGILLLIFIYWLLDKFPQSF